MEIPQPEHEKTQASEPERLTLLQKIGRLSDADKIRLALKGNREERTVLIRDSNKSVARAVLESPTLNEHEIELYASMHDANEEILRLIAANRKFRKEYAVIVALLNNPRVPLDITLPLVVLLKDRELKGLSVNRNVASVLRSNAAKLYKTRQESH
ncbi:MAG TPA: hypothetical protein VG204_06630 [Terriglobia bacterium]|nr:hypothetical protein [Terriglobia bacterium]